MRPRQSKKMPMKYGGAKHGRPLKLQSARTVKGVGSEGRRYLTKR